MPHPPCPSKTHCILFFTGLLNLWCCILHGQSYTLSQTGTYAIEIDNPTFISANGDEITQIPIGFNFDFFGVTYTDCFVGGDGFITFNSDSYMYCCGQEIPDAAGPNNLIAAAWSNMDFVSVHYEVFGTEPYRRLVVTFDLRNPCDSSYYGQVKLFETTNVIEIHTQQWDGGPCQGWNATQGLENADGTLAVPVPGRNYNETWAINSGDNDFVSFTPYNEPLYIVEHDANFNLEFQSPADITLLDNEVADVPIGFDFTFFGTSYNHCYASDNGFVSFDVFTGSGCCEGQAIPDPNNPNNLIALAWMNAGSGQCCHGGNDFNIVQYETIGSAPDRVFLLTFQMPEDCGPYYHGQLKLFESSNIIEIHTDYWADSTTPCYNVTQGIENASGTTAYAYQDRIANTTWNVPCCGNDVVRFIPATALPQADAGVTHILNDPFCEGNNLMSLLIRNFGGNTIDSVQIHWSWDDTLQDSILFNVSMPIGDVNYYIPLDTQNLVFGVPHVLTAWTSMPNGLPDDNTANDTMTATITVGLHGTFTIGGTSPDYGTIQEAVDSLQSIGICDSVIMMIRPGTYTEQITIPFIPGIFGKQIRFTAENGDSTSVMVQFNADTSQGNFVLGFNNAYNIVWENMTLTALGNSQARVIQLGTYSQQNTIRHCAINGKNTTNTSTDFACIYSRSYNDHTRIENNTTMNGSYGFFHDIVPEVPIGFTENHTAKRGGGGGGNTNLNDLRLTQNQFLQFSRRGIQIYNTNGTQIDRNHVESTKSNVWGIQLNGDLDTLVISNNLLYLPSGNIGIHLTNVAPTGSSRARIFNNMVNVPNPAGANNVGLGMYNCSSTNVYHNTIRLHQPSTNSFSLYHSGGGMDSIYNNILANTGNGPAIYIIANNTNRYDYNAFHITGSLLGTLGSSSMSASDLEHWRALTGYELHGLATDPLFVSYTDLHVTSSLINGAGSVVLSANEDIDQTVRSTTHPDIGADEFIPVANDAALLQLLSPTVTCQAEQAIEVVLANLGTDTLNTVTIKWTLNGIPQPDYLYTSLLNPEGDTAHVVIAMHTFSNQADNISIWVHMPNGTEDMQHPNDTLAVRFRLPLSGTYTIGGTTPDFATLKDAVSDLNQFFTCGPVVFKIRDGIYNEQIELDSIPTVSAVNTITFESESLDSSAVTIQYAPTTGDHPAVFMLKGTDYVTIRHLGFKALPSTWADCIELRYNSNYIHISNCYLEAYEFGGSSGIGIKSLCYGSPRNEFLTIDHNYFYKGQQAIYLYNCGNQLHDIHIEQNTFVNQRYTCMDLNFITGLYVKNNIIHTNTTNTGYKGIDLSTLNGAMDISGNIMNLEQTGDGMFLNGVNYGTNLGTARVYNNMIQTAGTGGGIRLWNCESVLVAFNSCNMTGSGPAFEAAGGDSLSILNNIFVSNTGKAFGSFAWTPHVWSDHNDLLTVSGNIGFWHDTLYATFEDWQAGTHFDSNSMSITPQFVSATDLHVLADTLDGAGIPLAGISTDIDSNPRHANSPDIGADEIGANDNDAGVFAILPEMPFARGLQPVKAVIRNYGGNTLTSVEVHWSLNNITQPPYNFAGSLPSLQQDTVILDTVDFDLSTPYAFQSWTSLPNGTIDLYTSNDTLSAATRYAAVSDTVTIGGSNPDVPTIAAAYLALSLGGVLDSVHFQIRTGTYHTPLSLSQTLGMNCNTPIIFESESGNAADVIWDNTGINAHTIVLDGSDGVQFRNLTIRTVLPAYHAVEFKNNATCNTFTDCHLEGVTTTSTSTTQAIVYSNSGGCHENHFIGNVFNHGSYGIYWAGDFQTTGAVLTDNTIQNAYYIGIQLSLLDAPVVHGNILSFSTAYSYAYGIYLSQCDLDVQLTGNQIQMTGQRGIGLVVNACHGTPTQPMLMANNFVVIGSGPNSCGIQHAYSEYANVYYNTVRITGGDGSGLGYYRPYATNINLRNNIFDNQAGGTAMYFGGNEGPFTSDYNDLLTTGPNLIYKAGLYYTDLAAWQTTDFDTNSISEDPMYVTANGFAITSAALNSVGDPVAEVTLDIEGQVRDTLTPDIGCDEFYLASDDVGILNINYPQEPFPSGVNTVFIKFVNNGQDTLTSMVVDWEVDGNPQPTYMWSGLLPSAGTYDSLDIGVYNFMPYAFHSIKVWVSLPNGVMDGLATNDTLQVDSLYPGLMGTYTIGGANPDFDSIADAEYHLIQGGAAGPVTLNLRPGTYLETINLNDFPGSDCNRPVIFQSENGDSSAVTIKNLGLNDNIITLNGTDGVIFQHLTLQSVNPAYQNVVEYFNGAHCNQFLHNQLIGYAGNSTSQMDGVIISTSGLDTGNVFAHNLIQYGSMGFYLAGTGAASHTLMTHNVLDHNYYHGIYATSESDLTILHNTILGGSAPYYRGIYMEYCHGANRIERNDIRCLSADNIIRLEACYAVGGNRASIINNFLSAGGTYTTNGLMINNCKRYDVFHNNIYLNSTAGSTVMYFHSDSSLHVSNTILFNAGAGQALFGQNQTSFISDYNDFRCDGNLGTWNGAGIADLGAWQTATGQDAHSLSVNPQFMSATNLHVSNILLNGTGTTLAGVNIDIDGDVRNQPPDIGADEFNPTAANDAGVFMYVGPHAPFAAGTQPITVALKNFGYTTLTSADIRWVVNGLEQPVYHWTGSLPSAQCDTIAVGNYIFPEYTGHDFILWSEFPNGVPDSTHINDTLTINDQYPALSGTYTVGGVLPDFNLFSQLEAALNKGGILGDVTFNIRNGSYSTQLSILDFPRSNDLQQVIFQSESGDSSLVTIKRDFSSSNNYTILLSDAHNITFRDLTLQSTQGRIMDIADHSSRITILHCRFKGVDIAYPSSVYQLIYSNTTSEDSVYITNNRFEEGDYGIYLTASGGALEKEVKINDNYFSNVRYRSIYTQYHDGIEITGNTIFVNQSDHEGIVVTSSANTRHISGNDIRLLAGGQSGIYLLGVSGTSGTPTDVSNNYVYIRNWGYASNGIYQAYCNYIHYDYNSVRLENTSVGSIAFRDDNSNQNIHLKNNNFANYSGGLSMYVNWTTPYTSNTTDYCNLFSTGPTLARYGNEYSNLVALQTGTGQNTHGMSAEPLFISETPLISQVALNGTATPIGSISVDIDGVTRHATHPDVGCKEFMPPAHDVGPKVLITPETYCGLGNAEPVTIRIQNYSDATETDFNVAYSLNGSAWVVENVGALMVSPGATADFSFTQTVDLSIPGTYTFALRTSLASDLNLENDTLWNIIVEHIPALTQSVSNMIPSNGETGLNKPVSLSWAPAPNATLYDIYIWSEGNNQPATPQIANLSQINTTYDNLSYGTNYHWRVVAKNICNQMVNSPVFDFGIRDLPDVVIDTVIAPPTAFSGETIQIEWQTLNSGPGQTGSQIWSDAVYLSTDATLNVSFDTYLGAVQNLTSLDSGMAYTQTGTFVIPNGYSGNYYVFVFADRWNNLLEIQDNNNWSRTSSPIMINLSPAPDLKVITLTAPSTTFSGQTITLNATVKNIGTGPTQVSSWYDRVYFGFDPLNYATGQYITSVPHNGTLAVDSTYNLQATITVPEGIFGIYYAYVVTDFSNQVFENAAESNNVGISDTIDVILTPPPDLGAYDLIFPDTVHNNQVIQLNYSLVNQGGSTISNPNWYDQIYISQAPVYNTNFLTTIGNVSNYGPMMPNDPTIKTLSYTMPVWTSGLYYYYITLDKGNQVFEYTFESNNTLRSAGTFRVVNPDMRTSQLTHPATVTAGQNMPLSWNMVNAGPGHLINRYWQTQIYLSTDQTLNVPGDILLKTLYPNTNYLAAGDTLIQSTNVSIPDGLSGPYYIHVVTDALNQIFEDGQEANNTGTSSIAVQINLPPYPDLGARELVLPDTITAGDLFTLQYEAFNTGMANAPVPSTDSFYLSFSPTWNPASNVPLGRKTGIPAFSHPDSLAIQVGLAISPQQTSNQYYLYIKSDAGNTVYEYLNESNNIKRSNAFFVNPAPAIDLRLDTLTTSNDTLFSGTSFTANWQVTNASATHTSFAGWRDALYLSVDSTYNPELDIRFFDISAGAGGLDPNAFYIQNANPTLPNGIQGNYYLLAVTDLYGVNTENDTLNNVNTLRMSGEAFPVNIQLSPSPDLRPSIFSAPVNAYSGQPFIVTWSVQNDGDAPAQNWNDKIYLSTDNIINQGDILLTTRVRSNANLMPSGTLTDTVEIFAQSQLQGNYILILKTDADQSIYEHSGENNNQITRSISFTMPPPSDLQVASIELPDSTIAGQTISIAWNTKNIGSNPTNGMMREIVYLSTDEALDVNDRLFSLEDLFLYIPPGSMVSRMMTADVSGVAQGNFYALVQTDARDNISESNDTNNLTASITPMHVAIEPLYLDSLTIDSFYNGQEHYFRLEIPLYAQNQNLRVTVDGDSLGQYTEMYIKYGDVPTLSDFDQKHLYPYMQDQELLLEHLQAGTYYLMFKGHTAHAAGQRATILAKLIDFELLSIAPSRARNLGQTTIELLGTQMDTMRRVYLVRDSTVRILADTIYEINSFRAFATFNLEGQPPGMYTVQAVRWDGKIAELVEAFEIIEGGDAPDLQLTMDYPSVVGLRNSPMKITIFIQNAGDQDLVNRTFLFEAPWGNLLARTYEDLINGNTQTVLEIPVEGAFGPPGILPPKSGNTIEVFAFSRPNPSFTLTPVDQ